MIPVDELDEVLAGALISEPLIIEMDPAEFDRKDYAKDYAPPLGELLSRLELGGNLPDQGKSC